MDKENHPFICTETLTFSDTKKRKGPCMPMIETRPFKMPPSSFARFFMDDDEVI